MVRGMVGSDTWPWVEAQRIVNAWREGTRPGYRLDSIHFKALDREEAEAVCAKLPPEIRARVRFSWLVFPLRRP